MQTVQEFENHFAGPEIEVAGGFVGQQDGRVAHQGAGQHHPLLFPSR